MTTVELCGHRWWHLIADHAIHTCDLPAGHTVDGPIPRPHRCRCGATHPTTTTEGTTP